MKGGPADCSIGAGDIGVKLLVKLWPGVSVAAYHGHRRSPRTVCSAVGRGQTSPVMSLRFSIRFELSHRVAAACALALCSAAVLLPAQGARAALEPATLIDGPSATILDVDGAAMAPDGSGGILYRKLIGGEPHLFVSQFLGGAWQPPTQVDAGQPFAASFPAIAAGDDGRLLVVWAEPWAEVDGGKETLYQLYSSELDPGATQFGPAQQVDPNDIGDGTAAYPSLAMAPNGQAYVAYRVVTDSLLNSPIVPPRAGDEKISLRVARYNGQGLPWTSYGTINNHPEIPMRHPSATNAPVIGVTRNGNAVVLWQEPNSAGVAEIFARRIFTGRLGNALQVSPETAGGQPITAEADAPALAVNGLGEARIAYRLAGGAGSPYGSTRIFLDSLPSEVDTKGAKLRGDSPVAGAPALGPPSIAIDEEGDYRLAYGSSGASRLLSGSDFRAATAPAPLGPTAGEQARTAINLAGGGVTIWQGVGTGGLPVVDAREDFAGGAWQLAHLSAPISGPVGPPCVGRILARRCADRVCAGACRRAAGDGRGGQGAPCPVPGLDRRRVGQGQLGDRQLGSADRGVWGDDILGAGRWPGRAPRTDGTIHPPRSSWAGQRQPPRAGPRDRQPGPGDDDPCGDAESERQPTRSQRAAARA